MNLKIDYHPESDTLWLGNGQPTPNGADVAENVTVFFDGDDRPNGVMIEHAAKLLRSILNAAWETGKTSDQVKGFLEQPLPQGAQSDGG